MKRLLLSLCLAVISSASAYAGEPLINLSLQGLTPGSPLPADGKRTPPLLLPSRVQSGEGNEIRVEENFSSGKTTLPGLSAVVEKTTAGDACYLSFVFPETSQPHTGRWKLRAGLLSALDGQRGNLSFTLRSGKEIAFYLQIGPQGSASTSHHGGKSEPLPPLPPPEEPLVLEIVFDFDNGTAQLTANGQTLTSSAPISKEAPATALEIGIKGDAATRTFAIHELIFSQE